MAVRALCRLLLVAACLASVTATAATPRLDTIRQCVAPGQALRVSGSNLGSQRMYSLELTIGRQAIKPTITSWQSSRIVARVPAGLSPGASASLVLRDRRKHLTVGNKIIVRLCAEQRQSTATAPPSGPAAPVNSAGSGGYAAPQADGRPPETAARDPEQFEPGEVLVVSPDIQAARALEARAGELGLGIKRRRILKQLGMVVSVLRVPEGTRVAVAMQQLQRLDGKLALDANHRYRLSGNAGSSAAVLQQIAWGRITPACGRGIRLGMIDTLVDTRHPSLNKAQVVTKSLLPLGLENAGPHHATAIASILVGRPGNPSGVRGLLPGARLYNAGVFRQRGDASDTTAELILSALNWLLDQRVHAINISIAGEPNRLLQHAVGVAQKKGPVLVAAAGNDGPSASPTYPAAWPGVIAVTAVDARARIYRHANRGEFVDFAAPGVDVWAARANSTAGAFHSGTSYAVPFVTAAAARLKHRPDNPSTGDIVKGLSRAAKDLGDPGKDRTYGYGLLQARSGCSK